jgi:peptidoglycan/xylan/chitin deacetylase (PgdA/CDA1 family)
MEKQFNEDYLKDVGEAAGFINSRLFRPPYGKIKRQQISVLEKKPLNYKIVMWTVLSGDFDTGISKEKCLSNVLEKTSNGSIIVFHDSEKAFERMGYALPVVLKKLSENGYAFEKIKEETS